MMKRLSRFCSPLCLGILFGGMVVIAFALIPYWNGLPPASFRASFQGLGRFLGDLMLPLLFLSIGLTLAALFSSPAGMRKIWAVSFLLVFGIAPLYVAFSAPINELLLGAGELSTEAIVSLRERWGFWHCTRTVVGGLAFALSLFAYGKAEV